MDSSYFVGLQIVLLGGGAMLLLRRWGARVLIPFGVLVTAFFSFLWLNSSGRLDGPKWLLPVILGLLSAGTLLFSWQTARNRLNIPSQLLLNVIGGFMSYVIAGMLGMLIWAAVDMLV